MAIIGAFCGGVFAGFIIGACVYRSNSKDIEKKVGDIKKAADVLKGD